MDAFIKVYSDLSRQIHNIEERFLAEYINDPLTNPSDYLDNVKAFCILAHALFENFFEEIAMKVMLTSIDLWYSRKELTLPLLTLVSYSDSKFSIAEREVDYLRVYDRLRKVIDESKAQFSKEIKDNHGISFEKYLKWILLPVSIDISQDPNIINSLSKLASERGSYAHTYAKTSMSPEDAKKYVTDCLTLCEEIRDRAISIFYEADYKRSIITRLASSIRHVERKGIQELVSVLYRQKQTLK